MSFKGTMQTTPTVSAVDLLEQIGGRCELLVEALMGLADAPPAPEVTPRLMAALRRIDAELARLVEQLPPAEGPANG